MDTTQAKDPAEPTTARNALKLAGEVIVPGVSLLVEGQILKGGVHFVVGTIARGLLGPIGLAVVAANSYTTSTTGKGILAHLK